MAGEALSGPERQGEESRLTRQREDEGGEEVRVPACCFSGGFDGFFAAACANEVEGETSEEGHVFGRRGRAWRDACSRLNGLRRFLLDCWSAARM